MVLTRSQYENMSKAELIQELTGINPSFVNDINTKLSSVEEKFNDFLSTRVIMIRVLRKVSSKQFCFIRCRRQHPWATE